MSNFSTPSSKPKFAILFRYGAGEHVTFLPALEELARNLSQTHEVHHFGMKSPIPPSESLKKWMAVHKLPFTVYRKSTLDKFLKAAIWLLTLPFLGLYLRMRRFDAVFVDEAVPLTAPLLRLFFGPRLAFTLHDFFVDIYFEPHRALRPIGKVIKFLDYTAWRVLPLVLCRVEAAQRRLTAMGFRHERIVVACDPCDLDLFAPGDRLAARKELGLPEEAFILVHHGVMHPNKGNDRLIRAVARARERLPNLLLLLVGDGPAMTSLQRLTEELSIKDRVRFTGWLPGIQEVSRYLQAADAAVAMRIGQPGDHFHVTSTLAHNLATGLPTLAARMEGFAEIIQEGKNGLLFDPEVGAEFDTALEHLYSDPSLRETFGARGRETAIRLFDVKRVGTAMAAALLSMARGEPANQSEHPRAEGNPLY